MKYENFNDAEALKIAMDIEEEGMEFYSLLMKSAKDDKAKDIFSKLASAEKKHLALFQEMYSKITSPSNPSQGCEDYTADLYLKDLVETGVFTKKGEARRLAAEIKTDIDALKIGIQAEKDSILYYTEAAKNTRHEEGKQAFEQLTGEEKKHLKILAKHLKALKKLVS